MAAMLAEIKSRMLLPRSADGEQEEDDPRAELVRRLLENTANESFLGEQQRGERGDFSRLEDDGVAGDDDVGAALHLDAVVVGLGAEVQVVDVVALHDRATAHLDAIGAPVYALLRQEYDRDVPAAGATLGGQVISRYLATLGIGPANGGLFFNGSRELREPRELGRREPAQHRSRLLRDDVAEVESKARGVLLLVGYAVVVVAFAGPSQADVAATPPSTGSSWGSRSPWRSGATHRA